MLSSFHWPQSLLPPETESLSQWHWIPDFIWEHSDYPGIVDAADEDDDRQKTQQLVCQACSVRFWTQHSRSTSSFVLAGFPWTKIIKDVIQ